ncbi:uncharacterized protein JN550_008731 [Neoarthrinium moseri]|uniref:uncharacterized protein n=1 Tax=Neoarthrinium moseri TaxID=1658444 RepID=UPI001FDB1207|nr:uncharacterized protein JN550_008731 [Neoarthrinium moseri]KAI1864911.1 hypothetical protein JN550_008731 [Neoarthrinium moseri]
MPIFRGIEISVVASAGAKDLPEYPHPDGSSVCLVSPGTAPVGDFLGPRPSDSSILSDTDPTRQHKINPRVAVYIPSMPGEQFWLKYNVLRVPPSAAHLYFKMFTNGRLITSWGIPTHSADGGLCQQPVSSTVVKALYEPGQRWYNQGTGSEGRAVGIETRYFHFMNGLDKRSVAEDGGLIEIQVFRSSGRKRRAPRLPEFRNQEQYGIASPSGGLVENPQDATYYDWLLVDPKDAPYATFRFHYRSMNHLLQLSLVPQSESRLALPMMEPEASVDQNAAQSTDKIFDPQSPATPPFTLDDEPPYNGMVRGVKRGNPEASSGKASSGRVSIRSPFELIPIVFRSQRAPELSKAARAPAPQDFLDRPLPDPPKPRSRHSSQSSLRSNCPSLTPSIADYVDDGRFVEEEVNIGTAHTVMCSTPSMVELPQRKVDSGEGNSMSDYEHSPPSSPASQSLELPSPQRYMSTTGSVLELNMAEYSSPLMQQSPQSTRSRLPVSASESMLTRNRTRRSPETLNLSESEWMRRTPSPVRRKSWSRIWSPRLDSKKPTLQLQRSRRDTRHSEIRQLWSSDKTSQGVLEEETNGPTEGTGVSPIDTEEEASTPRAANFGETSFSVFKLNPTMQDSEKHKTWESCRDPPRQDYEVVERPIGNWI